MVRRIERPLQVAIIGGGIVGHALALGLQRRGVSFTLYERSATLGSELGHGIGLTVQDSRGLSMLNPLLGRISNTLTGLPRHFQFDYVDSTDEPKSGPQNTAQETMFQVCYVDYWGAQRSAFLADMERLIQKNRIELGKKLVSIRKDSNLVVLEFEDGSTAWADVVVGCDGIRSRVRDVMFGPGTRASYTHRFTFRGLVPKNMARAALGDEKASRATFHGGSNGLLITYPERGGERVGDVNVVAFVHDAAEWPGTTTNRVGSARCQHRS